MRAVTLTFMRYGYPTVEIYGGGEYNGLTDKRLIGKVRTICRLYHNSVFKSGEYQLVLYRDVMDFTTGTVIPND
jgi:hypothetical protein